MWSILLSTALLSGQVQSDEIRVEEAREAFAQGLKEREQGKTGEDAFRRAATLLEELRSLGCRSAELSRSLGNAYLLAGDLPRAILQYRLGLQTHSEDVELRRLLTAARDQVVYPPAGTLGRMREAGTPELLRIPPLVLVILSATVYSVGWVLLTFGRMRRRTGLLTGGVVLLTVGIVLGATTFYRQWTLHERPCAVIARDEVLLRKGDDDTFGSWEPIPLNRGVEAEVVYRRGDWLQIQLSGGEIGWVHRREVVTEEEVDSPGE